MSPGHRPKPSYVPVSVVLELHKEGLHPRTFDAVSTGLPPYPSEVRLHHWLKPDGPLKVL